MSLWDSAIISRRFIIETINVQLNDISQIENFRQSSITDFLLNLLAGLVVYSLKENKLTLISMMQKGILWSMLNPNRS